MAAFCLLNPGYSWGGEWGEVCKCALCALKTGSLFAAAKSRQSCLTLCDPIDSSPPGSPIPGILQARTRSGLPFPSPMHESEK